MSQGDPIQLAAAQHIADKWLGEYRKLCKPDARIHICGSVRREKKMVRDLDILVVDASMHGTFQNNAKYEGVQLNLCFVQPASEGAAMLFLTGDHKFNVQMRVRAKQKGMRLNRYGLWKNGYQIAGWTEEGIFAALQMDYIPPTERGSPDGQRGIKIKSSSSPTLYEVFIKELHGYYFCDCRAFQYRRDCRHLREAELTI